MQKKQVLIFPNKESETAEGLKIFGRKVDTYLEGRLIEHTLLVNLLTKFGRGGGLPSTLLH